MNIREFISELKSRYPAEETRTILTALKQDDLVWQTVTKPEFASRAFSYIESQKSLWNPATLGLLYADTPISLDELRTIPLQPLLNEIRLMAAQTYETTLLAGHPIQTLGQAAMVALALRERCRLTESWIGFFDEMQPRIHVSPDTFYQIWHTPLACLFAMAADPVDVLRQIHLPDDHPLHLTSVLLIIHSVLANPLSLHEQCQIFSDLLCGLPAQSTYPFILQLQKQGRTALCSEISKNLIKASGFLTQPRMEAEPLNTMIDPLDLRNLQYQAAMQYLADDAEAQLHSMDQALDLIHSQKAQLSAFQGNLAYKDNNFAVALSHWEEAYTLQPLSPIIRREYARTLLKNGRIEDAAALLDDQSEDTTIFLIQAQLALRNQNILAAQEYARQAVNAYKPSPTPLLPIDNNASELIETLITLEMYPESTRFLNDRIAESPANSTLHQYLAIVHQSSGNLSQATLEALQAAALDPENREIRHTLISLYEQADDWKSALAERLELVKTLTNPDANELLELANCSLRANEPERVITTCNNVLKLDASNGLAHAYIGQALLQLGQSDESFNHFTQATLLSPERYEPWLMLADAYRSQGNSVKAMETLRAGTQASPESAELLTALGQNLLVSGSPTEALPAFRKAASLAPTDPNINYRLCDTLRQLGHLNEARQVLERTRQVWPAHPGLAYLHGRTLLELDEPAGALLALNTSLHADVELPEPYFIYASALLALTDQYNEHNFNLLEPLHPLASGKIADYLNQAQSAIEKACLLDSENIEYQLVHAQILLAQSEVQPALEILTRITSPESILEPANDLQAKILLGKINLALGQISSGLILLQEAAHTNPQSIEAYQALAEAYLASNLTEETLQTAKFAREMASPKLKTLLWYAQIAWLCNAFAETINALEQAIHLNPKNIGLWNQIAHVHNKIGEPEEARQDLLRILNHPEASQTDLSLAAQIFLQIQDLPNAAACLNRIIEESAPPSAEVLAQLARVEYTLQDYEKACGHIRNAIEISLDIPEYHLLHADILDALNRNQEAFTVLENLIDRIRVEHIDFPEAQVFIRLAILQKKIGDLLGALRQAESALQHMPDHIPTLTLATELAYSLLENNHLPGLLEDARQLLNTLIPVDEDGISGNITIQPSQSDQAVILLSLLAEAAINHPDLTLARHFLLQMRALAPNHPHSLSLYSQIASQEGAPESAYAAYRKALGLYQDGSLTNSAAIIHLAQAALAVGEWNEALNILAETAENAKMNPRVHLALAKAVIICAEQQTICQSLECSKHAPGIDKLSEKYQQLFKKSILAANRMSDSVEILHWHQRGQLVFNPSQELVNSFSQQFSSPEDRAAVIAACNLLGKPEIASQWVSETETAPSVLLQSGLLHLAYPQISPLGTIDTLLASYTQHPLCLALAAHLAHSKGEFNSSLEYIEAALAHWHDEPSWHEFAARVAHQAGQYPRAISHWKTAIHLNPEIAPYHLNLGESLLTIGQYDEAVKSIKQSQKLEPANPQSWMKLAQAYIQQNDFQLAAQAANHAIQLSPSQIEPLILCSQIEFQAGNMQKSLQRAYEALRIQSGHTQAVLLVARSLAALDRKTEAITWIDKILPACTDQQAILLEKAHLLYQVQDPSQAISLLEEINLLYPDHPDTLNLMAQIYAEMGRRTDAEKAAQQSLHIDPNQPALHLLLGRILRQSGELDQAVYHLTEAIQSAPQTVDAYLELGRVHQDRRENSHAIQVYQQAMQINPHDPRPYYQAGILLRENKDYRAAEMMFRQAAEFSPNDLNIRRQLGAMIAINLVHNPQEASIL